MSVIRASSESDIRAITEIYAHYVVHGTASFETSPPDMKEIERRRRDVLDRNLPYLVAENDGLVLGYAYAAPYRPRAAYRFTVEDSVYVHREHLGKGTGRLLLTALIEACQRIGCRQMVAVIGGKDSAASIALHRSLGFHDIGVLKSVGFKLGAWQDSTLMQRALGAGDSSLPKE